MFLVAILFAYFQEAHSTTFANRPLKDVIEEASVIVRGTTGESYSDWGKTDKAIYTYTYFTITEVLKGSLSETKILLRQSGGVKDGIEMTVPGAAGFKIDEDVVVILSPRHSEDGSYDVPGMVTGKYSVVEKNGETFLENSLGSAGVYDPNKDAGTLSYNATILLDDFRKIVKGQKDASTVKQFNPSTKKPAKGAFESGDDGHGHEQKAVVKTAVKAETENKTEAQPVPKSEKNPLWIILSFAALIGGAGFIFYKMSSKGGDA